MYPRTLELDPHKNWFGDDYLDSEKFVHTYLHKNYKIKMHSHEFYEVNIVIKGSGRHYIADTSIPATVGDVFVIPPEISHGYYTEDNLDIYHILLKNTFFTRYKEELSQVPCFDMLFDFEPKIRRFSGAEFNLKLSRGKLEDIKKELLKIENAENEKLYMYENILTINLISRLGNSFAKNLNNVDFNNKENLEIIGVMEYIKNNLSNKITLSHLAKHGNMSTATLNRRFKDFLNVSPMEYVIRTRVALARELIDENKYTKAEIAQICGFYDSVHLNKYLNKYGKKE